MNNAETLKAVIEKYKLDEPVPAGVRAAMLQSRRDTLAFILRRGAMTAFFTTAVVSFFLWIKKFGISLSIAKSAVAVSAAMIIGAGAVTATTIYTAGRIMRTVSENKARSGLIQPVRETKTEETPAMEILHYNVAVQNVVIENDSGLKSSVYTSGIISELRRIKGAKGAINISSLDDYHVSDRILSVSIMKLEENRTFSGSRSVYRISAKVINPSNSHIIMHTSVTAESLEKIPESISTLAVKISGKL